MISSRLSALKEKHETIEKSIKDELKHPSANVVLIEKLKRQKLRLKEEITHLEDNG